MARGFFVAGTDTGVGKTIIAGALVKALGELGLKTCVMKPIESGCRQRAGRLIPGDGTFLRELAHMEEPLSMITPVRFKAPLAPLPASEIEKKKVDLGLVRKLFRTLSNNYEAIVVEGMGGLMVPIRKGYFTADLAARLGLPLIVVCRPGLGTINHTLLTVDYALRKGLDVAGIIINHPLPTSRSLAERTNPEVLVRTSPVPLIGTFPHLRDLREETIRKAAMKSLDFKILRKYLRKQAKG